MANTKAQPELRKISIATVRSRKEAAAIVGKLSAADIESFLVEEKSFATGRSTRRQLGAVKVQVASRDIQRALQCLQAKAVAPGDSKDKAASDGAAVPDISERKASLAFLPLGVAAALLIALVLLLLGG